MGVSSVAIPSEPVIPDTVSTFLSPERLTTAPSTGLLSKVTRTWTGMAREMESLYPLAEVLTLTWSADPGRGGNGRGCQVAEVWLVKK